MNKRQSEIPNNLKHDKRTKEDSCQYSEYLKGTPCSTKRKSRVQCLCPDNSQTDTVRIDIAFITIQKHYTTYKHNFFLQINFF